MQLSTTANKQLTLLTDRQDERKDRRKLRAASAIHSRSDTIAHYPTIQIQKIVQIVYTTRSGPANDPSCPSARGLQSDGEDLRVARNPRPQPVPGVGAKLTETA